MISAFGIDTRQIQISSQCNKYAVFSYCTQTLYMQPYSILIRIQCLFKKIHLVRFVRIFLIRVLIYPFFCQFQIRFLLIDMMVGTRSHEAPQHYTLYRNCDSTRLKTMSYQSRLYTHIARIINYSNVVFLLTYSASLYA